jgi:hypothetical protein
MLDKACEPGVSNHWLRALKERPYDISHWEHIDWINVFSMSFQWNCVEWNCEPTGNRRWIDICAQWDVMYCHKVFNFTLGNM